MSIRKSFVLTIVGPDQPGIVGRVSALLLEHQANWLESQMANLAGAFAGILHADIDATHYAALLLDLKYLESDGLQIVSRETELPLTPDGELQKFELDVVGTDRAGIVRDISAALAKFNINIEEISTKFSDAPMSSESMFRATAKLSVPQQLTLNLDQVQQEIENIAHDLMTELHMVKSND